MEWISFTKEANSVWKGPLLSKFRRDPEINGLLNCSTCTHYFIQIVHFLEMKDVTYIGLWASVLQYSHIWLVLDHFWATWLIWYSFTPYGWVVAFLKDKNFWKYPIMQVTSIMSQKRITMNMLEWKSCKCSTVPQDFSILTIFNSNHAPFQLFRFQKMMYYP